MRSLDCSSFTKTSFITRGIVFGPGRKASISICLHGLLQTKDSEGPTVSLRGDKFRLNSMETCDVCAFQPPPSSLVLVCYHFVSSRVLVLYEQTAAANSSRWNRLARCDCWVIKARTRQPCQTFLKCKADNYQRAAECLS